jgi:hypothetical protein
MNVAWVRAGDVAAGVERVLRLLGSGPGPESFNTASRRERNVVSLPSVASGEVAVAGLKRSRWWAGHWSARSGTPRGPPRRFNQAQVLCEAG